MTDEKRTRTKKPKSEQTTVSVQLDDEIREKLLALNADHCDVAEMDVPLAATVKRAIRSAWRQAFEPEDSDPVRPEVPEDTPDDNSGGQGLPGAPFA